MGVRKSIPVLYFYFNEHEITCFIKGQAAWWNIKDLRKTLKITQTPNKLIRDLNIDASEWQYTYCFRAIGEAGKVIALSETGLLALVQEKAAPKIKKHFETWFKTEVLPEVNKKISEIYKL